MSVLYLLAMGVVTVILGTCIVYLVLGIKRDDRGFINGSLITGTVVVIIGCLFSAFMLFGTVPRGHVSVLATFGRVHLETIESEGIYAKSPFDSAQRMSVQRRSIRRTSSTEEKGEDTQVVALAKNDVRLTMDVEFPYQLNPRHAPRVLRYIGDDNRYENELVFKAAAKAIRDGVSEFTDSEAYQSKRTELNDRVTKLFDDAIAAQLRGLDGFQGFTEAELRNVIQVQPVQITRIEPPAKILNAIEEKVAAEQDLKRQETLTAIAKEIAERRRNEGTGIANFLSALPKNVSISDAVDLLTASAEMQRAQALTRAVEEGKVPVIYLSGDVPVAAK